MPLLGLALILAFALSCDQPTETRLEDAADIQHGFVIFQDENGTAKMEIIRRPSGYRGPAIGRVIGPGGTVIEEYSAPTAAALLNMIEPGVNRRAARMQAAQTDDELARILAETPPWATDQAESSPHVSVEVPR